MKNRYLKNARIPEKKVRELLNLFCQDLTATQIANISGISRITVNAYLKLIRTKVAQYCEQFNASEFRNDSPAGFSPKKILSKEEHEKPIAESRFYGFFKHEQFIYTKNIVAPDPLWLDNWIRGKVFVQNNSIEQVNLRLFEAVADLGRTKLFRVNNASHFIKAKSKIDAIDLFWGILRSRITKFRGLNSNTTYLHIKESEFRYNNRHADLFISFTRLSRTSPCIISGRKQWFDLSCRQYYQ